MIGFLKGELSGFFNEGVYLDVHGVGYELFCSQNTLSYLQGADSRKDLPSESRSTKLWVYTHVREDLIQLFGFYEIQEKEMFLSLLKVNGIGPKLALGMLSGARWDQLIEKIEREDVRGLTQLPKVGKKIAEQVILSLKGKLVFLEEQNKEQNPLTSPPKSTLYSEISSALIHLGFRNQDVEKVLSQLPSEIDFQEGVKRGLAALSNGSL